MYSSHLLLLFFWVLYGVLHSLFAALAFKKWVGKQSVFMAKYYRLFYSVFAVVSLAALLWFHIAATSFLLFQNTGLRLGFGLPIGLTGFVIMIISSKNYFLYLTGLEVFYNENPVAVLKTDGLHRYVRHPLYLGTFLFIAGLFFCFPFASNLIALLVIIGYTLAGIRLEEQKLVLEFGDAYSRYQKEVPMLLPIKF